MLSGRAGVWNPGSPAPYAWFLRSLQKEQLETRLSQWYFRKFPAVSKPLPSQLLSHPGHPGTRVVMAAFTEHSLCTRAVSRLVTGPPNVSSGGRCAQGFHNPGNSPRPKKETGRPLKKGLGETDVPTVEKNKEHDNSLCQGPSPSPPKTSVFQAASQGNSSPPTSTFA